MMDADNTTWQELMNSAYAKWTDDLEYSDFLLSLTVLEYRAVLLGNLNYQVENGGFNQWIDNRYALHGKEVVETLEKINHPMAKELAGKIITLLGLLDLEALKHNGFSYWLDDDGEDEDYTSAGEQLADSFTDWYYEVCQPVLFPAIIDYFESQKRVTT